MESHYIPGEKIQGNYPLDRYLPPIRKGVISTWLEENIPKGSWLLDPFGASPHLAIEAAQNGYFIIVTANNPVARFILEILSNPPTLEEFQSALALLATSQIGNERLEPHIKSLYETICQKCGQKIQVEAFIWNREEQTPYARIYKCPFCKDTGERPATSADIENAARFTKNALHRARALERVAPLNDPYRHHVEEALEVYLPRAIYALVTIINKLGSIPSTNPNRRLINALLLLAFDRANTLWLYPKERQRPKQLIVPGCFREHNIWSSLESAAALWTESPVAIPFTKWPETPPPQGGICLYEGRIRELASNLPKINAQAVITAFPRPNQAFWTLSALWSGWLWGPEAVDDFKSVLRRRRYDWGWHSNAIQSALNSLKSDLIDNTPYFGLISEVESGFITAVLIGARFSNLGFAGMSLRVEDEQAQLLWHHRSGKQKINDENLNLETTIGASTREYLQRQRGEPASYPYIHAASLVAIVNEQNIAENKSASDTLSDVHAVFPQALSQQNGFIRYGGSDKSLEVGQWWLTNLDTQILPLSDRVEMTTVNFLLKNPGVTFKDIDAAICRIFPGLTPPDTEMIQVCLESYAFQDESDLWFIREGDFPGRRHNDMNEIRKIIIDLGSRLGLEVSTNDSRASIEWFDGSGKLNYRIFISASAVLGKYLLSFPELPTQSLIILPGSRANLVAFKMKQNPYFQSIVERGWQFVKYRHLRRLADSLTLSLENFDSQLSLDPLTYAKPQIRLL